MPDRMGNKEVGVIRRQPVIARINTFKGTSMSFFEHCGTTLGHSNLSGKMEVPSRRFLEL